MKIRFLEKFASDMLSLMASQDVSVKICGNINEYDILILYNEMSEHF